MDSIDRNSRARLVYRRSGRGDRAVIFIHGFLDAGRVWNDVVAQFEDRNVELIEVDLAGMGERIEEAGPFTLDRFASDVRAVAASTGKPVVVVGQSMGAQVAELVAAALPQQVAGLVLLTPVPLGGTNLPDEAIAPFRALGSDRAAQRAVRRQLSVHLDAGRLEWLVAIGARSKPEVIAAFANAWNRGHPDGLRPSKHRGPVLIVRGDGDPFVNQAMIAAIAPRFEDATTAIVHAAGHWPHVEQPEAFATLLAQFLDRLHGGVSADLVHRAA
jgi:pimeloyl-ACP methyl ester carboxylesterase